MDPPHAAADHTQAYVTVASDDIYMRKWLSHTLGYTRIAHIHVCTHGTYPLTRAADHTQEYVTKCAKPQTQVTRTSAHTHANAYAYTHMQDMIIYPSNKF